MNDAEKLLTCPFCGGEAFMKVNPQTLNCYVNCPKREVAMKHNFKGNKKVEETLMALMAEAWNQRV